MSELKFNEWYINDTPHILDEIFGQPVIVRYFKDKFIDRKFDRNTLFTGKYGSGKTALAKIIAKSIACKTPGPDGHGCGVCPTCKAVDNETYDRDVVYLDAEKMSAQDVREFVEKNTQFPAIRDAAKVFICDEAQALSKEGVEAFLTATQNPKAGYFFIFTAMNKLAGEKAGALESRCKKWKMKEPKNEEVYSYLVEQCKKYGLTKDTTIPKDFFGPGLQFIAETSDASYRRAIQTLQQCYDGKIYIVDEMKETFDLMTYEDAAKMLVDLSNGVISENVWNSIQGKEYQDKFPLLLMVLGDARVYKAFGKQFIQKEEMWKWNQPMTIAGGTWFDVICDSFLELANKAYLKRGEWKLVMSDIICKINSSKHLLEGIQEKQTYQPVEIPKRRTVKK